MKKTITLCLLFVGALFTHAQTLTQAEKLYQEGDFATAQKQYQEIVKTATGNTLYQAQLRLAACQYHKGEYLTAAKTMLAYTLPAAPLWQARFLLYRTYLAQQAANIGLPPNGIATSKKILNTCGVYVKISVKSL